MKKIGPVNGLYPMPTTLIGAMVDGKANFLAAAHVGILNHGKPQYLSVGLNKSHYTNKGIKENKVFSICIPSFDLAVKTDYCGIVTGKKTDKSGVFEVFTGELENAPMIMECPVNMEMKLHDILDYGTHEIFVGEVFETHVHDDAVNEKGKIDISKTQPMVFDMHSMTYRKVGDIVGKCWNIGKELKK
jgi:flavin reductase (DIM6/NTAB) family NADH-FMN oxidoreductase RutF